jgi:hypothetical protein
VTHHLSLYPTILVCLLVRLGVRAKSNIPGPSEVRFRTFAANRVRPDAARIAHYRPRETVARMMLEVGLEDVRLIWVNQMLWSAIGQASAIGRQAVNVSWWEPAI